MQPISRVAILIPMLVGSVAVVCTVLIHSMAILATLKFIRHENKLGRTGSSFSADFTIVSLTMFFALVAHLIEIGVWAVLFILCREFSGFGTAYYHSAVNFTTLGYGDLIMTSSWKLLGPMEAADGMLMFGVSTAIIFAVIQRLVRVRFVDLNP